LNVSSEKLTNKKYLLQKIAKVMSIISLLIAISIGFYLLVMGHNKDLQLTLGVVAFFFSSMAVVLYAIAVTNLPDLSLKQDDV